MKNVIARTWYQSLGFEDITNGDGCRSMKRIREKAPVLELQSDSALSEGLVEACQRLPELLKQLRPTLDVLILESFVKQMELQAKNVSERLSESSSSTSSPLELGERFMGTWTIVVN